MFFSTTCPSTTSYSMSSGMVGASAVGGGTGVIDSAGIGGMAGTVLIRESPFSVSDD